MRVVRAVIEAKIAGRLTTTIPAAWWDEARATVRRMFGSQFREMTAPWRAFMYDGVWVERAKTAA